MFYTILLVVVCVVLFSFALTELKKYIRGSRKSQAHIEKMESKLKEWEKVQKGKLGTDRTELVLHLKDKYAYGCKIYVERPQAMNDYVFVNGLIGLLRMDPRSSEEVKSFGQWESYLKELEEGHGDISTGLIAAIEKYLGK